MTLLRKLVYTGVHFANDPSHRRSILLSNLVSLILFGLGMALFGAYYLWYGWSVITVAIPIISIICLSTPLLNFLNLSVISRIWLTLLIPLATIGISIYSKTLYYSQQEELDYFTFRIIILASCIFPVIFFSFSEKQLLLSTSLITFTVLMCHDPLHEYFGVPYRKDNLKETNYAFTNVVIFITYGILMGAIVFLKWISERSERRATALIQELNQTNEELKEMNYEIEAQNQEISAQSENLNNSQKRLQEAYEMIADQKNLLLHQNKNLSNELVDINQDLKQTNTELIKHNNELRQFSYTVSHNLRGPVASLIGLINLIDQRHLSPENAEIISHIQTSVKRLDNIIGDLSKIIDIRHDIFNIRQKINLEDEVQQILNGLRRDIETYRVRVITNFQDCPEIYSVKPMVHSILYNLISNAIKYRANTRPPEIEISSSLNKGYVLQVKDNGMGIDLKNHGSNIFKLYKRFHYHTEGKGLGLYLVKLQAESLGGGVEVESEINRHATFTVHLSRPENVERQVLYEEPFAKIFYDATLNATGIVWHGPVSSQQYSRVFMKCLEFVKAYRTPNYIADLSNQGYINRDDQQWMFREILPEAAQYGLKHIATIRPDKDDPKVNDYIQGISMTLSKLGIQQASFLTMADAVNWVQKQNEKNGSEA